MTPRERAVERLTNALLPGMDHGASPDKLAEWYTAPRDLAADILDADPSLVDDLDLGAAWRECEGLLREDGWLSLNIQKDDRCVADVADGGPLETASGATPAEALRALAQLLRERAG